MPTTPHMPRAQRTTATLQNSSNYALHGAIVFSLVNPWLSGWVPSNGRGSTVLRGEGETLGSNRYQQGTRFNAETCWSWIFVLANKDPFLFFLSFFRETYEIISWNFNGITRSNNLINFALQSCATTDTMFEIMDSVDGRKVYVQGPVSDS